MGVGCCGHHHGPAKPDLTVAQKRVMKIVLALNGALFFTEVIAGFVSHSTSLLADSAHLGADTILYSFTLYALYRDSERLRAGVAALKGLVMLTFGVGILVEALLRLYSAQIPIAETMGIVGLVAMSGNGLCLLVLFRHRRDDINMASTWLCSRNDLFSDIGVLGAAALVSSLHSGLPDVAVGLAIAVLVLSSAAYILKRAWRVAVVRAAVTQRD